MTRRAAPWWLFVLAASYIASFSLLVYCDIRRPEWIGFAADVRASGLYVARVSDGSPAAAAGLQSGDRIVAAHGRHIRNRGDWAAFEGDVVPGTTIPLEIERAGHLHSAQITFHPERWTFWLTTSGIVLIVVRLTQALTLATAMLVAFKRPHDTLAWTGAWLLASGSVFCIAFPAGMIQVWRALPWLVGLMLWPPLLSSLAIGAILFTFFASFPKPLYRSPWVIAALWTPALVLVAVFGVRFAAVLYRPTLTDTPPQMRFIMFAAAAYGVASLAAVIWNYRRLLDTNDRRRLRLIMPGSFVALVSGLLIVSSYWGQSPKDITGPIFGSPLLAIGTALLLPLPVTLAYAILTRRLFDISALFRQGVRYALARRLVLSLVPLAFAILVLDVASQRDRTVSELMAARRTAYVAVIGLAGFAHARRERWLAALDRRFFRERYDVHLVVQGITAKLREATNLETIAPYVVARLEASLHPQWVAVMVHDAYGAAFSRLASAPAGAAPASLAASAKLVALARVLGSPLRLAGDEDTDLTQQLPEAERAFVHEAGIDLLLPIRTGEERSEALMLLGSKRSEEPYSNEDLELLTSVCAALSPLVGRAATTRTVHVETTPRLLAGRYGLDRRLGAGGTGVVYAATDTALSRPVAVKLLRADWTESREAAERFRREAKVAASLTHPNVATVYDFGVDGQAFLVMELLQGQTVRDRLQASGRLALSAALAIVGGACAAVSAAHDRALTHGNLKPENLFLAGDDPAASLKVLDFGVATSLGHDLRFEYGGQAFIGTPQYMAPEQLRGEECRPSWDLWALGVIAYELITGALPYSSPGPGWPIPLEDRLPVETQVPLRALFARTLSVDPERRPSTAAALLGELQAACAAWVQDLVTPA